MQTHTSATSWRLHDRMDNAGRHKGVSCVDGFNCQHDLVNLESNKRVQLPFSHESTQIVGPKVVKTAKWPKIKMVVVKY